MGKGVSVQVDAANVFSLYLRQISRIAQCKMLMNKTQRERIRQKAYLREAKFITYKREIIVQSKTFTNEIQREGWKRN